MLAPINLANPIPRGSKGSMPTFIIFFQTVVLMPLKAPEFVPIHDVHFCLNIVVCDIATARLDFYPVIYIMKIYLKVNI